jgi:diamine N-acetyltransferase
MAEKKKNEVTLRAIEPEDLDVLYEIENDRDVWDCGPTSVPYSRYVLHKYLSAAVCDIYADKELRLIICNAAGESIGILDLVNFEPRHLRAEVGIVLRSDCRHKGYAASALSKLKAYCSHTLHLHQLYAIVNNKNQSSIQLFQSSGFQRNGILYDWFLEGDKYSDAYFFEYFF